MRLGGICSGDALFPSTQLFDASVYPRLTKYRAAYLGWHTGVQGLEKIVFYISLHSVNTASCCASFIVGIAFAFQ